MELKHLKILFTTQWLEGSARSVVALDVRNGQAYSVCLSVFCVGGAHGETISGCYPISYDDVRRLAKRKRLQNPEACFDPSSYDSLNENTWSTFLK